MACRESLRSKGTDELIEVAMTSPGKIAAVSQLIKERSSTNLPELIEAFEQAGFRQGSN